jgi:hypothetical protein
MRSLDGGYNWTRIKAQEAMIDSAYFAAISFPDSLHGTAIGSNGTDAIIIHTTDGGDTWTRQKSGVKGYLYAVDFTDSLNGTIVGPGGVILRTVNGGLLWVHPDHTQDSLTVQTYPDPTTQVLNFQYVLPTPQIVTLSIFDASGRQVLNPLDNMAQSDGIHTLPIDVTALQSGAYYFSLITEKYHTSGQFTIQK